MERLTRVIQPNVVVYVGEHKQYDADIPAEVRTAGVRDVLCQLAAYEDTGLTPEEVAGLCEMDKLSRMAQMLHWEEAAQEGRLLVLPCKLHESIYYLEDGDWFEDIPYEVGLGQRQGEREDVLLFLCEDGFSFYGEEVGKTVFLTIAEAEEKLREMQA